MRRAMATFADSSSAVADASPETGSGVWVIADPRSPGFGQAFQDDEVIANGARRGKNCLVTICEGTIETVLLLEWAPQGPAVFLESYRAQASSGSFKLQVQDPSVPSIRSKIEPRESLRKSLAQLGQTDIFESLPDLVQKRRVFVVTFVFFVLMLYLSSIRYYEDRPPSVFILALISVAYPLGLYLVAQFIHHRSRPVQMYVFELLLSLDIYQLVTSGFIFLAILREAFLLNLLLPPWGNPTSRSSHFLRKLIWLHYQNRIVELFDTVIRISQNRFQAYGALHVYLRLLGLWGWLIVCHVGAGDAYFHVLLDSLVVSVRFFVFTLTILRWNWNFQIDFGLNAPKILVFQKQHLHYLQVGECAVLALHGLCCAYWQTMPLWMAAFQVTVMCIGMSIFTDFYYSRDAAPLLKGADSRLTFSFDSSCWLFIYHFGVAKWIQDHVHVTKENFAFSGSSGGALVAAVLACEFDAQEVKDLALADFHLCQKNPLHMFQVGEKVLDRYLRDKDRSAERCSDHLRVLLTKVSTSPPLLTAEVASKFTSWREVFACLRASMHVPLAAGILPYPIPGRGWYYDGLVWAALFVPWRAFDDDDVVVRVSACGFPNSQIGPQLPFPLWWLIVPPSKDVLEGMFWMGYRDTAAYFGEVGERIESTELSSLSSRRCHRRARNRVQQEQIQQLRKHLRKNPKNELVDHASAARLIAELQATARRHWLIGFSGILLLALMFVIMIPFL